MKLIHTVAELREEVAQAKAQGLTIGLVPTMGALHEGHASLIAAANKENDFVVVSVFVNPTQFGPNEDLDAYPRTLEADCKLAEKMGANVVFAPSPKEMYPSSDDTRVEVTGDITKVLCGRTRPIHFRGVCTVVGKLFNIVCPDRAYFGQKDAQQLATIRRFVRDLNFPIEIVPCPIVREADGLAKSSRNTYLNPEERKAALILSQSLRLGREAIENGEKNAKKIIDIISQNLATEPLARIDYVEVVDFENIQRVETIEGETLVAIAVYIGKTRLIDNFIVK